MMSLCLACISAAQAIESDAELLEPTTETVESTIIKDFAVSDAAETSSDIDNR